MYMLICVFLLHMSAVTFSSAVPHFFNGAVTRNFTMTTDTREQSAQTSGNIFNAHCSLTYDQSEQNRLVRLFS